MDCPAGILVADANFFEDPVHQLRVLQNHQVRRKDHAVFEARTRFRYFLDLRDFLGRLAYSLQEQLLLGGNPAFGQGFFDNGNFAINYGEDSPHGKAGRRRHTDLDGSRLGLPSISDLHCRIKLNTVLR